MPNSKRPSAGDGAAQVYRGVDAGRPQPASLGPLPGYLGYRLRLAAVTVVTQLNERLADLDLRTLHFGTLLVIQANPGLSQSDVCAALEIHPANFAPLIAGLEKRGLVAREQRSSDRRTYSLRLTPDGEALLRRAIALQEQHEAELAAQLGSTDHQQLLSLLAQLTGR